MATYPKQTIATGPIGTPPQFFAQKIDTAVQKPGQGVDGDACHFCRRRGLADATYIVLDNPWRHNICIADATAIKNALDSLAE